MKQICETCEHVSLKESQDPCAACRYDLDTRSMTNWSTMRVSKQSLFIEGSIPAVQAGGYTLNPPYKVVGRKDDGGKLDMTLLNDMPRAIAAIVEVMQWAITKKAPEPYVRSSWLGVAPERYQAASLRHQFAAAKQSKQSNPLIERDAETDLLHLAHEACSKMMALENVLRKMEDHK